MLNLILFLPKVAIFGATMGSVNFFKKKRSSDLPAHIHHVIFAPKFGVDMKKLMKGIEAVLGKDLENTITELPNGFKPGRSIGMGDPTYTDAESLIEAAQGTTSVDDEFTIFHRPRLRTLTALVSLDTLIKLKTSNCFNIYDDDDHTQSIYENHRRFKREKFLSAAVKVLCGMGEFEKECFECEEDLINGGLDSDGDCCNCGSRIVNTELLNDTINELEKAAA
tara:strand:+ start:151 stop:819 length:669 start_codon:yes stop_codon:yes gene_type:complete